MNDKIIYTYVDLNTQPRLELLMNNGTMYIKVPDIDCCSTCLGMQFQPLNKMSVTVISMQTLVITHDSYYAISVHFRDQLSCSLDVIQIFTASVH